MAPDKTRRQIENRIIYKKLVKIGDLLMGKGRFSDAFERFQQASMIEPRQVFTFYRMALIYSATKNYTKANEHYLKFLKVNNASPNGWFNVASNLEKLGRWDEAIMAAQKSIHVDPFFKEPYDLLFILFSRQNKMEPANNILEMANRLDLS